MKYTYCIILFISCLTGIVLNAAQIVGGVAGTLTVKNSIIYNDTSYLQIDTTVTISNSAVRGNTTPSGSGNKFIVSVSDFKDIIAAPADTFSYYLSPTSTARNAGNTTVPSYMPAKDINGNDRIYDGTIDIGAAEYSEVYQNGPGIWGSPSGWNIGRVPTADDLVTVRSAATVSTTNAVCKSVIAIEAGASLTINPASQLNIVTNITNNYANRLIVKASPDGLAANGSLIFHNTTNNPFATVEMYSKASWNKSLDTLNIYRWQYFGIPVQSVTASPTFDGAYIRKWNQAEPDYTKHWVQQNNASQLTPFSGYEICQSGPTTYQIQGQLVNSDFTTYSTAVLPYTTNAAYPGQHIFANPYTAAIDINKLTFGTGTEATVYLYNTGSYSDWTGTSGATNPGNSPGQYTAIPQNLSGGLSTPAIPSMQGFLVKAMANSSGVALPYANFSISYSSVVTPNTSPLRTPVSKRIDSSDYVYTRIDVTGVHFSDRMWIFTVAGCTHNFNNGWDGAKMLGSAMMPQIFAIEPDGLYQVSSVDDINNTQLGFQAGQDKDYILTFTHQNLKNNYTAMYLFDMTENKTVDITESGSTYSFTAESASTAQKRFIIVSQNIENDSIDNATQLKVFTSGNTVFVQNFGNLNGEMALYDMMGHSLKKADFGPYGITAIQVGSIPGAYVINASTSTERVSKKIIFGK